MPRGVPVSVGRWSTPQDPCGPCALPGLALSGSTAWRVPVLYGPCPLRAEGSAGPVHGGPSAPRILLFLPTYSAACYLVLHVPVSLAAPAIPPVAGLPAHRRGRCCVRRLPPAPRGGPGPGLAGGLPAPRAGARSPPAGGLPAPRAGSATSPGARVSARQSGPRRELPARVARWYGVGTGAGRSGGGGVRLRRTGNTFPPPRGWMG